MGLFGFGKKEEEIVFYPGGRILNLRMSYGLESGIFTYKGNYGSKASFPLEQVCTVEVKQMNDSQGIIVVHGDEEVLGTLDLVPLRVCSEMQDWLIYMCNQYGQ